jgi:hypothetical protein
MREHNKDFAAKGEHPSQKLCKYSIEISHESKVPLKILVYAFYPI